MKGKTMKKKFIFLQLLADGGAASAGAGASGSEGGGAAQADVSGAPSAAQGSEDLSKVVYGKSDESFANSNEGENTNTPNDAKEESFDELVKKGGRFHEDFAKRTQDIINKRFGEVKSAEDVRHEYDSIMNVLSAKYGVDATDVNGIQKAIEADDSLIEEQAFAAGMPVDKYRETLKLRRENEMLRNAEAERLQIAGQQQVLAKWQQDAEVVANKYGLGSIDLSVESENPNFINLLSNGVDFETAYMVIHRDEVMNGVAAVAAKAGSQAVVNSIASRASRPSESGFDSSAATSIYKTDPSKFTDADMDEVIARARRGEKIRF